MSAPVISDGYVKIPNSLKDRQILEISARCAAKETKGGTISVARDNCGEDRAFNSAWGVLIARRTANRHTHFEVVLPCLTVIGRNRDVRTVIAVDVSEVDGIVAPDANRGIAASNASGYGSIDPGHAVVP